TARRTRTLLERNARSTSDAFVLERRIGPRHFRAAARWTTRDVRVRDWHVAIDTPKMRFIRVHGLSRTASVADVVARRHRSAAPFANQIRLGFFDRADLRQARHE